MHRCEVHTSMVIRVSADVCNQHPSPSQNVFITSERHPMSFCYPPTTPTHARQPRSFFPSLWERPAHANANVDSSAPPSVAQLAGRFREQAAAAKETPASKPARRKPPCSLPLPLLAPRADLGPSGEEKSPPNASHPPKVKVKSSPLIEKLQANLSFDPAALLPGASPKSPGFKAMVSPFHSPPSTPSSPGVQPRSGEGEEVPVSFDQPPEGGHLPCCTKVRTRGSIKRRPPSRRFRRSQSDCGDLGEFRAPEAEPSQENGAKEENGDGDEVFPAKGKTPGSPRAGKAAAGESAGKPPLRRASSRTERGPDPQDQQRQRPTLAPEASEPPRSPSPGAENGCGSPEEDHPAGEEAGTEKPAEVQGERPGVEDGAPGREGPDGKDLEAGSAREQPPQSPSGGAEGLEHNKEEQGEDAAPAPEPGLASLETAREVQPRPQEEAFPNGLGHAPAPRAPVCCQYSPPR
ncbi:capZ-interacting protein [Tupaia chinensis]|uniref:capZ-interacting protein n=1 Tax=Tupaia chinensis TaxID=246437 RepID=UPI000FFC513C|nr:capZ-interacting protein [Tupaia chinensis]